MKTYHKVDFAGHCSIYLVVCVCMLLAACMMKLNQYFILVFGSGGCAVLGMWEGVYHAMVYIITMEIICYEGRRGGGGGGGHVT